MRTMLVTITALSPSRNAIEPSTAQPENKKASSGSLTRSILGLGLALHLQNSLEDHENVTFIKSVDDARPRGIADTREVSSNELASSERRADVSKMTSYRLMQRNAPGEKSSSM